MGSVIQFQQSINFCMCKFIVGDDAVRQRVEGSAFAAGNNLVLLIRDQRANRTGSFLEGFPGFIETFLPDKWYFRPFHYIVSFKKLYPSIYSPEGLKYLPIKKA